MPFELDWDSIQSPRVPNSLQAQCHARPNKGANSLQVCDQCLRNLPAADALVVGASIHLLESRGGDDDAASNVQKDIQWLRSQHPNMIWVTAPRIDPVRHGLQL